MLILFLPLRVCLFNYIAINCLRYIICSSYPLCYILVGVSTLYCDDGIHCIHCNICDIYGLLLLSSM